MIDNQNEVTKQLFNAPSLRVLPDMIYFNLINGAIVPTDYMGMPYTKQEIIEAVRVLSCYVDIFPDSQVEAIRDTFTLRHTENKYDHQKPIGRGDGFIYLISRDDGACKIGYSKNPKKRLKAIKRDFVSAKLELEFPADEMREAEYWLHYEYREKYLSGEWFNLDDKDIGRIKTIKCFKNKEFHYRFRNGE